MADQGTKKSRFHGLGLVIGLSMTVIMSSIQYMGWFESTELRTYDLRFNLRGPKPPPDDIVLVTIDESTRKVLKKSMSQISRSDYASVVDLLAAGGARLVVLDIDFAANKEGDHIYAEAITCAGNVILSSFIALGEWVLPNDSLINPENTCRMEKAALGVPRYVLVGAGGVALITWESNPAKPADKYRVYFSLDPFDYPSGIQYLDVAGNENSLELTLEGLAEGAVLYVAVEGLAYGGVAGMGAVNVIEDIDDRVRRLPMVVAPGAEGVEKIAALSLETAVKMVLGANPELDFSADWGLQFSGNGKTLEVPLEDGRMLINYIGGRDSFTRISFGDVLEGDYDPEYFEGKIVMVGNTHQLAHDEYPTPFGRQEISEKDGGGEGVKAGFTSGLEIHANAVNTILRNDYIYPLGTKFAGWYGALKGEKMSGMDRSVFILLFPAGMTFVTGLAGTFLFIFMRVRVQWTAALFAASVVLVCGGAYFAFVGMNIWVPVTGPLAALMGTYGGGMYYHVYVEGREKRWIKDTFGKYLAPSVVERITNDPSLVKLGGEELELTAFFSDIQGFTSISEQLGSPTRLVELLNDYLSVMADTIEKYEGTVDKYEGDAVIAFWGAPVHFPDHALKACLAALDQQMKLGELRDKWKKEGKWPEIVENARVRMGINTGQMVVGNMGSKGRMNYTIMGDAVNLAARLEAAGKQYGIFNMISQATYERVKDHVEVRELDRIKVVGKKKPVTVYELLARKNELGAQKSQVVGLFMEGLMKYRAMEWDGAIEKFKAALDVDPEDGPSKVYIDRCEAFKKEPPPGKWDGVFEMKTK